MSGKTTDAILFVLCQCGLRMRGTADELVPQVQKHAREAHNMTVTREEALARAQPET
jgi:predicted small metal-binding protein